MNEKNNRFKIGSGCFKCESCSKMTRDTGQDNVGTYCESCENRMMHENTHSDGNFKDDDCGEGKDCLVKDYTKKERWWL